MLLKVLLVVSAEKITLSVLGGDFDSSCVHTGVHFSGLANHIRQDVSASN